MRNMIRSLVEQVHKWNARDEPHCLLLEISGYTLRHHKQSNLKASCLFLIIRPYRNNSKFASTREEKYNPYVRCIIASYILHTWWRQQSDF